MALRSIRAGLVQYKLLMGWKQDSQYQPTQLALKLEGRVHRASNSQTAKLMHRLRSL